MKPEYIILHNSLTLDSGSVSWSAIRKYHTQNLGWDDIGYHFGLELIGRRPEILVGRQWNQVGAHCKQKDMNRQSIGICFVGDFNKTPVPRALWTLGIKLCATLMETFGIPHIKVLGHCEVAPHKRCPGSHFDLMEFRKQLWERWIGFTTV